MIRPAPLLLAALAACAPLSAPPPTVATLPPGVFGPADQDLPATQYAQYAFADSGRTYGNPAAAAEAVLALDYLAGAVNGDPRYATLDPDTKQLLLDARAQARAAIGVAPGTSSQLVVDDLLAARNALASNNAAAAEQALSDPAFTKGGPATVRALANLPYIREANVATQHAAEQLGGTNDTGQANF